MKSLFLTCPISMLSSNYLKSLGKESIILNNTLDLSVEEYFNNYQIEYHKKGYLFMYQGSKENIDYNNVKQATLDDVDALVEFYESAPLDVKRGKDSIARSLSNNRRTFIYKENGDIFASILTTGETLDTAMIGGVHYLNDEVLNCVLRVIVNELQMLGKKVYVVLRDSTMIRVFKETGFTKLKPWSIVGLRRS
ncbi:MAG: hypothetical protein RBQ97_08715 [Acholeplasma sp.]|nr:hypothetical protein [Acholeplasma sp.]